MAKMKTKEVEEDEKIVSMMELREIETEALKKILEAFKKKEEKDRCNS